MILFVLSVVGNLWQHSNPETVTTTVSDTVTVYEQLPSDTVVSKIVKYYVKHIQDTTRLDSLQALLDSVMSELAQGDIREYTDTVKFKTGDSLHVGIKGVLFSPLSYVFFPSADKIKIVTNTTTIYKDSRDDVWFTFMPMLSIKHGQDGLYSDVDLMLGFRTYGVGVTFGYGWDSNTSYKGVKIAKFWDVPKIKLLP